MANPLTRLLRKAAPKGSRLSRIGDIADVHSLAEDGMLSNAEAAVLSRLSGRKEREFMEVSHRIPLHKFTDYNSYLETGHKKVWVTFRACRIISSYLVSAKLKVVRKQDNPNVEDIDVTSIAGLWLEKPNPYDSWEDLVEMYVFHMELTGNAYWLKDELDAFGRPKALYPLLPQHMRVKTGKTKKYEKYIYRVQGREIEFDPEEIIHFKRPHPSDLNFGMGSIEPSEPLYEQFINADTLENKFMEQGAQVSGILTKKETVESQEQWDALKEKFRMEYSGKKNAGKTAFLNGDWSYHKLGMTMAEMQSLESSKWGVEQICMNHGIPLSIMGFQKAANRATAIQDDRNLRKLVVVPLLDVLVGKLNADGFFRGRDDKLCVMYELDGLLDVEQIQKEWLPVLNAGVITRNEMREKLSLAAIADPAMDQILIPANLIPIELAGFGSTADGEGDTVTRRGSQEPTEPPKDPADPDVDPDDE